jgi:LysM repeat protein
VHIVEAGDTIFGIALMYGVDPDQIRQLNASSIGPNDLIQVGQELVITLPSQTPVPTPLSEPPTPTPETVAEGDTNPEVQPNPQGALICVSAYHDRDGNLMQDAVSEELLPNAEFTLANATGVVNRYVSDGYSEPYCFPGLAAGSYRVIQNPPPGYTPNGSTERDVAVAEGTRLDLAFGNIRSDGGTGENNPESGEGPSSSEDEGGSSGGSTATKILSAAAKVSGVLVLLLAAGMAVLFVVNRRRM